MNPEKIGNMIKEIRQKEKLTQQEFARLFGVTYQAVSKWENGYNIPDIAILTEICNRYSYDIQSFLNGNTKKKKTKKIWLLGSLFLIVCLILGILLFNSSKDSFQFKTISANCENFEITGSMAYDKEKASIYISNVSYCGEKSTEAFQEFTCTLYEAHQNDKIKIDSCDQNNIKNATLEKYLSEIKFQINDYASTCKNYTEHSLFIEIEALKKDGTISSYKIPLKLESNCS